MMSGELLEALQLASAWAEEEPENPEAWAQKAEVLELLGRTEAARKAAARGALLDPSLHDLAVFAQGSQPEELPTPLVEPTFSELPPAKIGQLGGFFSTFGWALAVLSLACTMASIVIIGQAMPEILRDPAKFQGNPEATMELLGTQMMVVMGVSFAVWFATLAWLAMDVLDRKGPWSWLIGGTILAAPFILVPYCGPGWLLLPLYFLLGRKKP